MFAICYFSNIINLMPKINICIVALLLVTSLLNAQNKPMQSLENLLTDTSGWPLVKQWVNEARNKVEILPANTSKSKEALYKTQVTTRSPMGAIIYFTGGIIVNNGWIRILGSGGNNRLNRDIPSWNQNKSTTYKGLHNYLLVADDMAGGFFAINGGELGNDMGNVYYLSPDNLKWESLERGYSDFLDLCFNGDLNQFYNGLMWDGWLRDAKNITDDQAVSFYPFLWTKEGKNVNTVSRKAVAVEEVYQLKMDMQQQLLH